MSIELAEQLKQEWTNKYVIVNEETPELRRFVGYTGQVKTVNMNCRAVVEFNHPVDIAWYDVDVSYLTVVDKPIPPARKTPATPAKATTAKTPPPSPKPAGKPAAGLSPLELARQQGAGGKGGSEQKAPEKPKAAPSGLSPLELARQQGAGGNGGSEQKAPEKPKAAPAGLSPLELARQQGAGGKGGSEQKTPEKPKAAPAGLSPLELARQQGAYQEAEGISEAQSQSTTQPTLPANSSTDAVGKVDSSNLSTEDILELARKQGPFSASASSAPAGTSSQTVDENATSSASSTSEKVDSSNLSTEEILELARKQGPFSG